MITNLSLTSHQSLLSAVTQATQQLLTQAHWEDGLQQALQILSTATGVDRARLWKVGTLTTAPGVQLLPGYTWLTQEGTFRPEAAIKQQTDSLDYPWLSHWLTNPKNASPYQLALPNPGLPKDLLPEHQWLINAEIAAVLMLPVRLEETLVHVLSLEHFQHPYRWSETECDLLANFTLHLGGVLELRCRSARLLWSGFAIARQQQKLSQQQCQEISESRLRRQNQVLVELSKRKNLHRGNFTTALQEITQVAAETLEIERTSVWIYNRERTQIYCLNLYQRTPNRHSQGTELLASFYPEYFEALEQERTIAAHDAHTDSRTHEFADSYLTPLGITSMLDAPIWLHGQMVGVICHEHIGEKRQWTVEEQQFAASIADLVSLAMEARDRHQAEEELRKSEERLQSFFNATFEGVLIHDQGRILDVNHAAESLFRYQAAEMIGMLATELATPESHPLIIERIQHPSDEPFVGTGLRKDGTTFVAELSGKKIIYQGRPARVVGIRDITERQKAEAALEALNANLEQQVEERTAQLQQKMQELQELNQLKDVFLHAVSHDLRTPVMGTLMVLKNILHPPGQPEAPSADPPAVFSISRTVLERMIASNNRQITLIDSLLESHTSDGQGMILHPEPTQLGLLVQGIVDDLEPLLLRNQATVDNRVGLDLPLVDVDTTQLRRVYENLITNALKHNPPGLTLTLQATQDGNTVVCTVRDNGVGIQPEQADHLFDLYFRGSHSRHLKGIGLGLYLCKQIIKAHEGEIGVISAPGEGANFWFSLPLAASHP